MPDQSRHDAWRAGGSYDLYMGRWSRQLAPAFLDWLNPADQLDWLEIGVGTGALSEAVMARCRPASFTGMDASEAFLELARTNVADQRAAFLLGDARAVPVDSDSVDMIVSGLVLNFVPDREKALAEMKRVARNGGTVGFYVWDYPGRGMEMMRAFWEAAVALDPDARDLAEDRRFPFCNPDGLTALAEGAGLRAVDCVAVEVPTVFTDFEDYWHPFTLGAGPAPGYCMSLDPGSQQQLKERLARDLPRRPDGSIALKARAWAVRGAAG
ncbi:class I SAM-dependent methyltransferase [Vineibacter terrae]|uniref:Class I SAM-dependent methyltransferase n=1 Tax=Vineibacter terrae TaxID=2586908 RepID=A0A5C8PEI2_9HYPH|nr:class I SAM-dependent methyltransferase [Vineibacter terrae]TXL72014.1 class I SAM-dependent methyltransferase [Vineibacter terrae]